MNSISTHDKILNCLAISNDGKLIVSGSGSRNKTIDIWDRKSANLMK